MKFRVARHTNNLKAITTFYTGVLGLKILGSFKDHDTYNGVFLGVQGLDWHLEFTSSSDAPAHQPDEDDLLVFYADSQDHYNKLLQRFSDNNIPSVTAKNPYWNVNGATYLDPDGFRIVIAFIK